MRPSSIGEHGPIFIEVQQLLLAGLLVLVLIATLTGAGGAAAEEVVSDPDAATEEFEAAPAIAARLLADEQIRARYGPGRTGGNYIADVARFMGPGTDFGSVAASDTVAYACEVATFLHDRGADEVSDSACAPPNELSFSAISAGEAHTCAVADGTAYCWGSNAFGQLGNGTSGTATDQSRPVKVSTSTDEVPAGETPSALPDDATVTAISAGFGHTCAVVADGTAYCWGFGLAGQLGNGLTDNQTRPVAVATATDDGSGGGLPVGAKVTAISAGRVHTCAVADDTAYCWGRSGLGQLGNGTSGEGTDQSRPVKVSTSTDEVPAGETPSALPDEPTVDAISAGRDHTCAVADGTAYCWGSDFKGQLGNDLTGAQTRPVAVATATDDGSGGLPEGATVDAISAGRGHTCAVADDRNAYCWGDVLNGRLGNGRLGNGDGDTPEIQPLPVRVLAPAEGAGT